MEQHLRQSIEPAIAPKLLQSGHRGHQFHTSILRQSDIRGIVGETLSVADAHAIGRAFGTIVGEGGGTRVCVGYDGRLSSVELATALIVGLRSTGVDVVSIGRGPTPMLYFAEHYLEADGGIMVTGSHNPPEYNGFKMVLGHRPFHGQDIRRLGEIARRGDFAGGRGKYQDIELKDEYVDVLVAAFHQGSGLKVAWDAGNGASGEILRMMAARLPGRHVLLNETIDGTFPAHHPDPTMPENLVQLQRAVREGGCDLGIAFDGDGDRIGVVDEKGRILWGDQLMVILADDVLGRLPGSTIIADVKASQVLFDEVKARGGKGLMWRTGHSLIKAKMAETGAPLAGEMSGHIFFADDYYGFDDAQYAAVRLLDILARSGRSLAEWRDSLPPVVNTPELRFECSDERKFEVIEDVRARLLVEGAEVNAIDGVRVTTKDGWWLLRASNTQAVLVARCESASERGLGRLKAALVEHLLACGVRPPNDFSRGI